jgi:hypothetical protein
LSDADAGANHRGEHGDEIKDKLVYGWGSNEAARKMWAHTEQVVDGLQI